ncbi:MAG: hypothetical protein HW380_3677 [Magnetococcales bacterium]|nr:hypothetical protein [Magnetococcales bacterium]
MGEQQLILPGHSESQTRGQGFEDGQAGSADPEQPPAPGLPQSAMGSLQWVTPLK